MVPFVLALTVLEQIRPLAGISIPIVDAGIMVFAFGAILLWLRSNSGRLAGTPVQQAKDPAYKIVIVKAHPYPSADGSVEGSSALAGELPHIRLPVFPALDADADLRRN